MPSLAVKLISANPPPTCDYFQRGSIGFLVQTEAGSLHKEKKKKQNRILFLGLLSDWLILTICQPTRVILCPEIGQSLYFHIYIVSSFLKRVLFLCFCFLYFYFFFVLFFCFFFGGGGSLSEMESVIQVQILKMAVYISLRASTLRESPNPSLEFPVIGKYSDRLITGRWLCYPPVLLKGNNIINE